MKGLLVSHTGSHPRTHNLVELINRCCSAVPAIAQLQDDARILDQYYLPSRYPDGLPAGPQPGWPTAAHANEALTIAQAIFNQCQTQRRAP